MQITRALAHGDTSISITAAAAKDFGRKKGKELMKTRIIHTLIALALTAMLQGTAAAQLVIDDFTTGAYRKTLSSGDNRQTVSGNMEGGERFTYFRVCKQTPCSDAENEFRQSVTFQTRPSKDKNVPSALILSSGYKTFPLLQMFWGIDAQNNVVPLHQNLTPYDRMRVSFDGIDDVVNFNLQLYSPTGNGQLGCNLGPVHPIPPPFTVDFPLAEFVAGAGTHVDYSDITYMDMLAFLGGGYAITKYEAINSQMAPPPSFICHANHSIQPESPMLAPDFSLATTPILLRHVPVGYRVALSPSNGFTGTVALSCTSPQVTQCSVSPVSISGNGTAILSLSSDFAGSYPVTLTGTSGNLIHTKQVAITVPCTTNPCE